MPTLDEQTGVPIQQLNGALDAGIGDISQQQDVPFYTYRRAVLPADGFIFWIRTGEFFCKGMLHHTADRTQAETDTATVAGVTFTTTTMIAELTGIDTDTLIVGVVEGVRYAFSRHANFAGQAYVWHYQGTSIPAPLGTQLIDDPQQFDAVDLIVSDSLPAWLGIVGYNPDWLVVPNPGITLYPSYAVPDNIAPPYGVVHNDPEGIRALQAIPLLRSTHAVPNVFRHSQLTAERVRVTLYGCNNSVALDWLDVTLRYCRDTELFGLMAPVAVRDGKRIWNEGMILAQEKMIDFEVSYVQTRIADFAQQLILQAAATVIDLPV